MTFPSESRRGVILAPNPELNGIVNKALEELDKKRSQTKGSVKSKLKANAEKSEQTPKKNRTSKAKEELNEEN